MFLEYPELSPALSPEQKNKAVDDELTSHPAILCCPYLLSNVVIWFILQTNYKGLSGHL